MRSTLVINTKPPYSSQAAKEAADAALASAAFGVQVGLLFLGDGVFQLVKSQNPDPKWMKRTAPLLLSLELYDISRVYAGQKDLISRGLTTEDLMIPVTCINQQQTRDLLNEFDNLMTF